MHDPEETWRTEGQKGKYDPNQIGQNMNGIFKMKPSAYRIYVLFYDELQD